MPLWRGAAKEPAPGAQNLVATHTSLLRALERLQKLRRPLYVDPPPPPPPPQLQPSAAAAVRVSEPERACLDVLAGAWEPLPDGTMAVPLVAWNTTSSSNAFTERGYEFSRGSEGYAPTWHSQPPAMLAWEWVPEGCAYAAPELPPPALATLLAGRWLHFVGDSLMRDHFYDVMQALAGSVDRVKVHHGLAADLAGNAAVTFDFITGGDPEWHLKEPCSERGGAVSWAALPQVTATRSAPDVLIYGIALWDLNYAIPHPEAVVSTRIACEIRRKPPQTLGILRLPAVYNEAGSAHPAIALYLNELLRVFAAVARERVVEYNAEVVAAANGAPVPAAALWHIFDAFPVINPRRKEPGFTHDSVHYPGVASSSVTHGMLNIVAGCDALCAPPPGSRAVCACATPAPSAWPTPSTPPRSTFEPERTEVER